MLNFLLPNDDLLNVEAVGRFLIYRVMASSEDREADDSEIGKSQSGKSATMIGPVLCATPRDYLVDQKCIGLASIEKREPKGCILWEVDNK